MSPERSTELIESAAEGRMPDWAEASTKRRKHVERVSELLGEWAAALRLSPADQVRWRAAGTLHDVLRDADPAALREQLESPARDLPARALHGPAAAQRLRGDGVDDEQLLDAVHHHTFGRPGFGRLGRALMAADFLEPGRPEEPVWRASLRARMPESFDDVFAEVLRAKLDAALGRGQPLRPEQVALWNEIAKADGSAG